MNELSCLIVDDEELARTLLENYIQRLPYLNLVGKCSNPIEALQLLQHQSVDLIFLDIQMPEVTGIEFLKMLKKTPATIFTTAYSEYALEGYELGLVDYLLKPIRFDRFLKAINRILQIKQVPVSAPTPAKKEQSSVEDFFFVKADGIQHKVAYATLDYIESKGNFVQLHTAEKRLLTADTLTKMDQKLNPNGFLRVHKSYIINTAKVTSIEGNLLTIGTHFIPISRGKKEMVVKRVF